jgi:hypothetical protein
MPLPDVCTSCLVFNAAQNKIVHCFQIESSFACQIRCPCCYPGVDRKGVLPRRTSGHLTLKLEAFTNILSDFSRAGIRIEVVEFQGHGEPLINKRVWEMIRVARALFPDTHIRVVTNGNFDFQTYMATSGISEIIFSIDGVDQATYDPYRVAGNFDQAYIFMRDFCAAAQAAPVPIGTIWKYILFDHCSSEAHLEMLCKLAEVAGVNDVLFIITQAGPSSRRFFKSLLDLCERAEEDAAVFDVLQGMMRGPVSASWLSGEFQRYLGRSPFPQSLTSDPSAEGKQTLYCATQADQVPIYGLCFDA